MNEEIKEQLDSEISSKITDLTDIELGTDEYKNAVECLTKLIDKRNEIDKVDLEQEKYDLSERMERKRFEKEKELDEYNKKDQLIKNIISISGIVIPVFVTVWGTYKTLKFEETGTVTTIMGRGFINKLIPKK